MKCQEIFMQHWVIPGDLRWSKVISEVPLGPGDTWGNPNKGSWWVGALVASWGWAGHKTHQAALDWHIPLLHPGADMLINHVAFREASKKDWIDSQLTFWIIPETF